MNTKKRIFLLLLIAGLYNLPQLLAQEPAGYIIAIEDNDIFIDLTAKQVKQGDVIDVYSEATEFIHPVTQKTIKKEPEFIGNMEVVKTAAEYSVAKAVPSSSIRKYKVGMILTVNRDATDGQKLPAKQADDGKVTVAIAPTRVNDIVGVGYFGEYVSDMLMEEIISSPDIRLIDRSFLLDQMDEADLAGSYIDAKNSVRKGKISGIQYRIEVTMQKPDVTNISTGISLAYVMGAAQSISGVNIGAQYASNVKLSKLKSAVAISARVVDMQTGEVLFMCSGEGNASGETQLELEQGALSGAQINGGAAGFKQTVTGKATQMAFKKIGKYMKGYFAGDIKEKAVGRLGLSANPDAQALKLRGSKLYLGTQKLDKETIQMTFENNPDLYFNYLKGRRLRGWGFVVTGIGISALTIFTTAWGIAGDDTEIFLPPAVVSAAVAGGGIIMIVAGKKKMNNTVKNYNLSVGKMTGFNNDGTYRQIPALSLSVKF